MSMTCFNLIFYLLFIAIFREKTKKFAEQAAALCACIKLNLIDNEIIEKCKVDKLIDYA